MIASQRHWYMIAKYTTFFLNAEAVFVRTLDKNSGILPLASGLVKLAACLYRTPSDRAIVTKPFRFPRQLKRTREATWSPILDQLLSRQYEETKL